MESVIMAGGEGSRLRPLTCDNPKPMARLCGRPALCYIIELLARHGVSKASLTLRYLPNAITDYFDEKAYAGVSLRFVEENEPLGTAGSVKNAAQDPAEDILVISGDALCDVDLTAAIARHKASGADATLIVTAVDDPREYGLVVSDKEGFVTGFVEKPGWEQARVNAANTGIYILSPFALSLIPEGQPFDFAKDLFPKMLEQGLKLAVFETKDYWCDIGDLDSYRSCQMDMLASRVNVSLRESVPPAPGDYTVIEPVFLGEHVTIGKGAVIGPGAVLDDGTTVCAMAKVRNSVLLPGSYVGEYASISGSVLCEGASVKRGAQLFEGAVVGPKGVIGENAKVLEHVRIWPGKTAPKGARVAENIQYGSGPELFDDDGVSGEAGADLTPMLCARLGCAAGSLKKSKRVGIAFSKGLAAKALAHAVTAGILSTGAQAWSFGQTLESCAAFAAGFCGLPVTLYVSGGPRCGIKILGEGGLPPRRELERELEGLLKKEEFTRCGWDGYRDTADMAGMRLVYQQELYRTAPKGLVGMSAQVRSADPDAAQFLEDTLLRLGCDCAEGMMLNLSADGESLTINDESAGYLTWDKIVTLNCLLNFLQGKDAAIPYDAPRVIDGLAEKYGRQALRYVRCPTDHDDDEARQLAQSQWYLRDGMLAAVRLLHYCKTEKTNLSDLCGMIPDFATVVRDFEIDSPVGEVLSKLDGEGAREGVMLTRKDGSLLLRPVKSGRRIKVFAESVNAETARSLCDEVEEMLCGFREPQQ